jgi:glycosyltransferase involved in cell wall biosynthesis
VVTKDDETYLRRLAAGLPTVVIPNGVDGQYFHPGQPDGRSQTLAFVGNMAYPPNLHAARVLLTEILPRVRRQVPGTRAVIVGPSPPPHDSRDTQAEADLTGWVPDVRPHLEGAACFVSPLSSGTGIRNKILEAMAMAVPVVATPLSCEGIQVTDGEDVLIGRTPAELAAAATRLLGDESLRRRIGNAGRRLVLRDHTWEMVADRYEALYHDLIAAASRRTGASVGAK